MSDSIRQRIQDAAGITGGQMDAILTELQEPTEGMIAALVNGLDVVQVDPTGDEVITIKPRDGIVALVQHIRDGGS